MKNSTFIGFLTFMFMSSGILQGNEITLLLATAFGVAALLCHSIERVERAITGRLSVDQVVAAIKQEISDTRNRQIFVKDRPHPDFDQPEESWFQHRLALDRCVESGGCDEPGRRCDGCPKENDHG